MPYYKDAEGKLHFLDDAKHAGFLPVGCVEITEIEVAAIRAPTAAQIATAESEKAKADLIALDISSVRAMREYIAGKPDAPQFLKDKDAAAAALRAKIK